MSVDLASKGQIAKLGPYEVHLEPGDYYWCTCGRSKTQPWCDGSHKGTGFKPKKINIAEKGTYWMCGCKHTADEKGFCDGTHNKPEVVAKYNTQLLQANTVLREQVAAQKRDVTFALTVATAAIVFAGVVYFGNK